MHFIMVMATMILAFCFGTMADNCNSESFFELNGNYYCTAVEAIRYENVGTPGVYRQIVDMSPEGKCTSVPKSFGGPLSPLDEEVSLHFRGPLNLKSLAVYNLNGSQKRELSLTPSLVHRHQRLHKRSGKPDAITEFTEDGVVNDSLEDKNLVYETPDGILCTCINFWFGPDNDAPNLTPTLIPAQTTSSAVTQPMTTTPTTSRPSGITGEFSRIGYYNSATEHLDGLIFLGNHGGDGSGTFDSIYGASLSYLSADGTRGASTPQILSDSTISSAVEFTVMTDSICNDDCGFVRPDSVAYHGFEGADKVFLMEFQMPLDGNTGFQGDMPAIWMLNAQIPRTVQYGDPTCSCWSSGCGELDIVEVLSPGLMQCKSTLHTNTPAGDSDYIERPTTNPMKLAVIFRSGSSTAHIQVLDKNFDFGPSLTIAQIENICASTQGSRLSVFDVIA